MNFNFFLLFIYNDIYIMFSPGFNMLKGFKINEIFSVVVAHLYEHRFTDSEGISLQYDVTRLVTVVVDGDMYVIDGNNSYITCANKLIRCRDSEWTTLAPLVHGRWEHCDLVQHNYSYMCEDNVFI